MNPPKPGNPMPRPIPVSAVGGVAGQLLERGLLAAPTHPGLLASLDSYATADRPARLFVLSPKAEVYELRSR